MKTCINGCKTEKLYPDHREPPLEIDDCLCADCCIGAIEERLEEVDEEKFALETLKAELSV